MSQEQPQVPEAVPAEVNEGEIKAVQILKTAYARLRQEIGKVIVGQEQVLDELLIAMFCQGHCILEGVPGVAKTLMISTLAESLQLKFRRIQFTPDLMPADITGTDVIQENKSTGERELKFIAGPVFANVLLADEINRTPPKTQAALLEAMQEKHVTVGGERHDLELPFFVLATQNPIEQEGTYPLPEAQQDRFMFKILVGYPKRDEEFEIVRKTTDIWNPHASPVLTGPQILKLQEVVRKVPVADHVINYAMDIVRATRINEPGAEVPEFVREYISWGAGPRACQYLILGGKARAVLHGRFHVSCRDVARVAGPVLRHRIITNFAAESEGVTPDVIVERLLATIPSKDGEVARDPHVQQVLRKT